MTLHYYQSIATAFLFYHGQLQDKYHLEPLAAIYPALNKVLSQEFGSNICISSGHVLLEGKSSPYLDLIISKASTDFWEKEGNWALVDGGEVLAIVHSLESEGGHQLRQTIDRAGLTIYLSKVRDFLPSHAGESLEKLLDRLSALPLQAVQGEVKHEKSLVLDKKLEQGRHLKSSSLEIPIPLKEPLRNSPASSAEERKVEKFDPGSPRGADGNYLIHQAVLDGDTSAVSEYLEQGGDPELKNKQGYTALHLAARWGRMDIAELLLESQASVNNRNYTYWAPLHLAVKEGREEMCQLLIDHGAEVEARNNRGNTSLHIAAVYGQVGCAAVLLKNRADIHATMEKSMQPLHLAAWYGQAEIAQMLIGEGADLNAPNEDGNTALHFAAFNGQVKVIKVLMVNGADPSRQNDSGDTYLDGINEGYSGEMIKILD